MSAVEDSHALTHPIGQAVNWLESVYPLEIQVISVSVFLLSVMPDPYFLSGHQEQLTNLDSPEKLLARFKNIDTYGFSEHLYASKGIFLFREDARKNLYECSLYYGKKYSKIQKQAFSAFIKRRYNELFRRKPDKCEGQIVLTYQELYYIFKAYTHGLTPVLLKFPSTLRQLLTDNMPVLEKNLVEETKDETLLQIDRILQST